MMRLHSLQHIPLEGPGRIAEWVDEHGHDLREIHLADEYEAFHWQTDMFDLPEGMTSMGRTERYPNQAFVYDDRVAGIQFHLDPPELLVEVLLHQSKSSARSKTDAQESPSIRRRPEDTERPIEGIELLLHNFEHCFDNEDDR